MVNLTKVILDVIVLLLSVILWIVMLWSIDKTLNLGMGVGPEILIVGVIFLLLMLLFTVILLLSVHKCSNMRTLTIIWVSTIFIYSIIPIKTVIDEYQREKAWDLEETLWMKISNKRSTWEDIKPLIAEVEAETNETSETIFKALLNNWRVDLAQKMLDEKGVDIANINLAEYLDGRYSYSRSNEKSEAFGMSYAPMVAFLLDNGCDVNTTDYGGNSSLMYALFENDNATARLLLDRGANFKPPVGDYLLLPLSIAVQNNNREMLLLLLGKGADASYNDIRYGNALCSAAGLCTVEIAQILYDHGANVNSIDYNGETALYKAVAEGNEEVVQFFIMGLRPISL